MHTESEFRIRKKALSGIVGEDISHRSRRRMPSGNVPPILYDGRVGVVKDVPCFSVRWPEFNALNPPSIRKPRYVRREARPVIQLVRGHQILG